jgi:nanoRNase/pAp phosphatase (c-di-AMP/oligoRNAs hydrolase)
MSIDLTRSREFSAGLFNWLRGKGRILIVAHDNPDPDALAAAFALRHLFEVKAGLDATIAFGGIIGRAENRVMVEQLEIKAVPLNSLDLDEFCVICMVDTQPGAGNNSFPVDREVHLVIDHHPMRAETERCRWSDIRENYGASATILYEYLLCNEVYFGTKLATILFYAVKSETQDLGREWGVADRAAYLNLLQLSNNKILFNIAHAKVPADYFALFARAIENTRLYDNVLVFNLYDTPTPESVAEMADWLLRMQGVDYVFGLGRCGDRGVLSLRTTVADAASGSLMRATLGDLGTGGGHGMTAGGQIDPLTGNHAVLQELEHTLTRRFLQALNRPMVKGRSLAVNPS